jgi:DNA ligase-1
MHEWAAGRMQNVSMSDIKVHVCLYAFDCLYLNGQSLLKEPFSTRRKMLYEHFQEVDGQFL